VKVNAAIEPPMDTDKHGLKNSTIVFAFDTGEQFGNFVVTQTFAKTKRARLRAIRLRALLFQFRR
jgi:hypothetical protein